MSWDRIRGHAPQVEMFRRSIRRNRLPHALLFVGPEGVGKRLFAQTLAACLLCERSGDGELQACGECSACRQMQARTHPDFHLIELPEGKSELPIELFVGSRDRRGREGLCYELSLRPMAGERRIAVIDDANLMNESSANALLKTLEEPPPHSLIILIGSNAEGILPTIRSRCQQIRFAELSEKDVAELLLKLGWVGSQEEAEAIAALSQGSLRIATQLLDPKLHELRRGLFDNLSAIEMRGMETAARLIEGIEAIGGDTQEQRQTAVWMVRFTADFYRRVLSRLSGHAATSPVPQVERFVKQFPDGSFNDTDRVMTLLERTLDAERQLDMKSPPPLTLEVLFNDLARLTRAPVGV